MTDPQSAPMGEQELIALAEYHESQCNHHVNGKCATAACLRRGGNVSGKFDWDNPPSTCVARETATALRAAASPRLAGETIQRLQRDCFEAYQVIGTLASAHGEMFDDPQVQKALDNLSAAQDPIDPRPHDDLLPFTLPAPSESVGWRDSQGDQE